MIQFSGGKDSTACVLHLLDELKAQGLTPEEIGQRVELWHQKIDAPLRAHTKNRHVGVSRDAVVDPHFFAGLNELERLGHPDVRFTIHEDMNHDVWERVYGGQDLYDWLLLHRRDSSEKDAHNAGPQ